MKKKNYRVLTFAVVLTLLAATLASCAAGEAMYNSAPGEMLDTNKSESFSYGYAADADMEHIADEKYAAETMAPSESGSGNSASQVQASDSARKLIKNVSLEMETKTFDEAMAAIEGKIAACGGYVQSSSSWGGGINSGSGNRRASMTVRIPAANLDAFCGGMSDIATIVEKSENTQDVTLTYYDMESHMKALRQEYDTLIGILEKCTELKDVITVQSRITEVLYQIESYQTQLNNYDSLVAYSTVSISLREVERVTIVVERTVGQRMMDGLTRTFEDLRDEAEDFAVDFVVNLPYMIIWIVILGGGICILVVLARRSAKKRAARRAAKAAQKPQPPQNPQVPQNPQK